MKKIELNKKTLDELLVSDLPRGTELCAVEDKRIRVWIRKKGLVLGFEVHLNGKRVRKTIGRYGDITITQFRNEYQKAVTNLVLHGVLDAPCTVEEFFNGPYLRYSMTYHKDQRSVLCNFKRLTDGIKIKRLNQVGREDVQQELQALTGRGLSGASVNRVRALLSGLFRLAEADGLIVKSPVTHVPALYEQIMPAVALSDRVLERYIQLTMTAENTVHGYALTLAALTGARISEIRAIQVADIAADRMSFTIKDTKNGDTRVVHMGVFGAEVIAKAMEFSSNGYLFSSHQSSSGYMTYPRGTHDKIIAQMLREGVITNPFMVKNLRSTLGTRLYQSTGNLEAVRRQLGHRTLTVAARHYLHPSAEHSQGLLTDLEKNLTLFHSQSKYEESTHAAG